MIYMVIISLIIGIVFILRELKSKNASIITLFVSSYLLFFVLFGYSDVSGGLTPDNFITFITLFMIMTTVFFLVVSYKNLSKNFRYLSFRQVIHHINNITNATVIFIFLLATFVVLYFYFTQGLMFQAMPYAGESAAHKLQRTQYSGIKNIFIIPAYSFVALVLLVRIRNDKIKKITRFLSILIIAIILMYLLLCGRRIFLYGIVLLGIFYLYMNKSILTPRNLLLLLTSGILLFMGSNLYQNIRMQTISSVVTGQESMDKSVFEMMTDFDATTENLSRRSSVFSLNYRILERQLENGISPSGGEVILQSLENSTPRLLNPWKNVVGEDVLIAKITGLYATDLATNIFAVLLVDFGFFAILVFIVISLLNFLFFNFLLKWVSKDSTAYLLIFTLFTTSVFQLETPFGTMIGTARTALMIAIIFKIMYFFRRKKYSKVHL